jgi:tRNA(Ile)-lysidine synthase
LEAEGIAYRVDATNKEDLYARNKIRNRVLPYVEENISAGAVEHIAMAAQRVSESQEYIRQTVETLFEKYVVQEEKGELSVFAPDMIALHPFLRSELILSLFEALVPYRKDIGAVHVGQVEDLMLHPGNRQVDLPYGMEAKRRYDVITLSLQETLKGDTSKDQESPSPIQVEITEGLTREVALTDERVLKFQLFPYQKGMEIPQNQYTKWFDYDKIKNYITVRNRLTGDYLTINEALQRKSLQDYMVDAKIPKELRDGLWLLADGQHILWVVGYRISQEYKVTENTKRILQVQLLGGNEHGTY